MTQENKELLLKDLCVRLPYKTYVKTTKGIGYVYAINTSQLIELSVANDSEYWSEVFNIDEIKPYLRPISSMSEEEENEWHGLNIDPLFEAVGEQHTRIEDLMLRAKSQYNPVDWLNAHHFDYRGLIERGLAIAVTEESNPYKE